MLKTAWNFIIPFLLVAAAFAFQAARLDSAGMWAVAGCSAALAVFCANFFRNPERIIPADAGLLVSPADGRVLAVEDVDDPYVGKAKEVRVFLNVFNVHVQRSPFTTASTVESTRFYAGKFLAASLPKASLENEQHWIRLKDSLGGKVVVKQIAGLIARRILSWVRPGDKLEPGQLVGLIQFGSQVDLVVPRQWEVLVSRGDKVKGGETPMVRRKAASKRKR